MTVGTPREDCDHRERYTAQGGHDLCEFCARLDAGWKPCAVWSCVTLTPPDERLCAVHVPEGSEVCAECKGEGNYDCDEPNCHGEFCQDGERYCEPCHGRGTVEKEMEKAS